MATAQLLPSEADPEEELLPFVQYSPSLHDGPASVPAVLPTPPPPSHRMAPLLLYAARPIALTTTRAIYFSDHYYTIDK